MKKGYVTPVMYSEEFMADEYVAACYKIKCTTPNNNSYYKYIYADTNGNGVWDSGDQKVFSYPLGFHGCGKYHKGVILDNAPEANGFVTKSSRVSNEYAKVFYWKEDLGASSDYHVMTPGEEEAYITNPNAS